MIRHLAKHPSRTSLRFLGAGALWLAVLMGGCSSISTPLTASTAMSAEDSKKAIEELNKKRESHEHDAEKEIEQAR